MLCRRYLRVKIGGGCGSQISRRRSESTLFDQTVSLFCLIGTEMSDSRIDKLMLVVMLQLCL